MKTKLFVTVAVLIAWARGGQCADGGITLERMRLVYEAARTPYKYGIVMRGDDGKAVDCPSVFRHGDHWYMVYICMNDVGYETHLARSDDLLQWKTLEAILPFRTNAWDQWQAAGGIALCDPAWEGSHQLQTYDGKFWLSYVGGALQGYETDPLSIGMAWTLDPSVAQPWTRLADNPVLSRDQPDARPFEKETLYRSHIIRDPAESLGYPFRYYCAVGSQGRVIALATSQDMRSQ